ncbi:tetratricopeptide repeat protein [Portibacter marinus]|uniref:tetratricopeptide repeat protein n=1 Tax=Portibacter marinus TaxID=2898660 RepID=UPI001F46733C|nr:hypothetical protein [Portibacter marinus]
MKTVLVFIGFSMTFSLQARTGFEITTYHKEAYDLIVGMRFEEGKELIAKIKREQPENVLVYHIENYIDFISIFISEEEEEFRAKEPNKNLRLKKLQQGDPSDPYYLFSQAEVHLQWAMTRLKFQEYFTAAREVNKAIGMLNRNQELFPDFISNKKSLSILHAVAGTIPDKYKGIISLVTNFSGTIDQGLREITEVLEKTDENYLFRKEAIAIKGMVTLHLKNDKEKAWNFLVHSELARDDNPMATFLMANAAINCKKNDHAIEILRKRTRSPRFFPFYYLDLMLGSAKLSRLDSDADVYLKSYIQNFEGQDYFKDAYRKLAWHALVVLENRSLYKQYMTMCLENGVDRIDEDKSALKEAEEANSGMVPNHFLLKARILFDGGYFDRALKILSDIDINSLTSIEVLEHSYRKGRIYQEINQVEQAIVHFSYCVNNAQALNEYYSCSSALQLGILYEAKEQDGLAEDYFRHCLQLDPPEYKSSLHQKAKAGLNRL